MHMPQNCYLGVSFETEKWPNSFELTLKTCILKSLPAWRCELEIEKKPFCKAIRLRMFQMSEKWLMAFHRPFKPIHIMYTYHILQPIKEHFSSYSKILTFLLLHRVSQKETNLNRFWDITDENRAKLISSERQNFQLCRNQRGWFWINAWFNVCDERAHFYTDFTLPHHWFLQLWIQMGVKALCRK